MNDNYYLDDLVGSLEREIVMERYYSLIPYKRELIAILNKAGAARKEQVSDAILEDIRMILGDDISILFARFIHIYDFNKSKLREIKCYAGTKDYDALAELLRLPGVPVLRAELYFNSGVTLEVLADQPTEVIRNMVCDYISRENRSEIVPQPKEVNCHREVAKINMLMMKSTINVFTQKVDRLYDEAALERLQSILLFKELEFSLRDIKEILDSPSFDRSKALEQQIHLLELRKEHPQNLIELARGMKMIGVRPMSFEAFDTSKIDEYARQSRDTWGKTPEYKEYQQKEGSTP